MDQAAAYAKVRERLVVGAVLAPVKHWLKSAHFDTGVPREIIRVKDIDATVQVLKVAGRECVVRRPGGRCIVMSPLVERNSAGFLTAPVFFAALENAEIRFEDEDTFTVMDGKISAITYRFLPRPEAAAA